MGTVNQGVKLMSVDRLYDKAEDIARGLERMAEEVRQAAKQFERPETYPKETYGQKASRIQHTVLWGLANLNLDALTNTAGDADKAAAGGSPSPRRKKSDAN